MVASLQETPLSRSAADAEVGRAVQKYTTPDVVLHRYLNEHTGLRRYGSAGSPRSTASITNAGVVHTFAYLRDVGRFGRDERLVANSSTTNLLTVMRHCRARLDAVASSFAACANVTIATVEPSPAREG